MRPFWDWDHKLTLIPAAPKHLLSPILEGSGFFLPGDRRPPTTGRNRGIPPTAVCRLRSK